MRRAVALVAIPKTRRCEKTESTSHTHTHILYTYTASLYKPLNNNRPFPPLVLRIFCTIFMITIT